MLLIIENVPVEFSTKSRNIPQWKLEENGLVEEFQQSPAYSKCTDEIIKLVLMGCAQIRISAFTTISANKEEYCEWK